MAALPTQRSARDDNADLAALQVYYPAIRDLETSWRSGATLIDRLSMPQLVIGDMSAPAKDEAGWLARLRLFTQSMTTRGLMILFGTDSLSWLGPSVAGYSDLLRSLAERLSSVEGIPLTRLLGQSPAGLSSDDASGTRTYYDLIQRYRRTVLLPVILAVYRIAQGPNARTVVFPPLGQPSKAEQAATSLQYAQRDAVLIQSGVITDGESRARFTSGEEKENPQIDEALNLANPSELDALLMPNDSGTPPDA